MVQTFVRRWRIVGIYVVALSLCAIMGLRMRANKAMAPVTTDMITPGQTIIASVGRRPAGDSISHRFFVLNPYPTAIRVKSVHTSCGCTVASALPVELTPGQRFPLDVKVDTGERSGLNEFEALIDFDGQAPGIASLRANLVRRIPDVIDFGNVERGHLLAKLVDVVPAFDAEKSTIKNISYDASFFNVSWTNGNQGLPIIKLEIASNVRGGGFSKRIYVDLALDGQAVKQFPAEVRGWVLQDVEPRSSDLDFGMVRAEQPMLATVSLYSPYKKRIRVLRVEPDLPGSMAIRAVRYSSADDTSCDVDLSLNPQLVRDLQVIRCDVIVKTDDKEQKVSLDCYAGRLLP